MLSPDSARKYLSIVRYLKQFREKHGRLKSIAFSELNAYFFGYKNLISHVKSDCLNIHNPIKKKRYNKTGEYGEFSLERIVDELSDAFGLRASVLEANPEHFEIDLEVVFGLKKKIEDAVFPESTIILVGSTYQGKQLGIVPRSIFKINTKTKNVWFCYFPSSNHNEREVFEGKFSDGKLVYLRFSNQKEQKLYILKKGDYSWDKIKLLKGTYVGDDGKNPMAGAIFCEKVENMNIARQKLKERIPSSVQFQLLYTQIREKGDVIPTWEKMKHHHFATAIEEINSNFVGEYYGVYLSSQSHKSILTGKLEIRPDGSVKFYGNHNKDGDKGWIYLSKDKKTIYLRFKYNEKLNIFKYFITLTHTHHGNRFYGSYGGGSNYEELSETGRIVFFKKPEKELTPILIQKIKIDEDSLAYIHFLNDDRLGPINEEALEFLKGNELKDRANDFSDSPMQLFGANIPINETTENIDLNHPKYANLPKKYVGVYEAYIIQVFNDNPKYRVQKVAIEIKDDRTVIAQSGWRTYQGKARKYIRDKKISFHLAFEEDYPEIYHTVGITNWDEENFVLCGTYTGTGRTAQNKPIGGRILMFKKSVDTEMSDVELKNYDLSSDTDMDSLAIEKPGVLSFFLGQKDSMMEGYGMFKESKFLPISHTSRRTIKANVSGYYLSFRIRTDLETISIVPLMIDDWANVRMKSTRKRRNGGYREYSGVCELINDTMLSLRFHALNGQPFYAQSKFNKSYDVVSNPENRILMGVFLSSNIIQARPFACIQVLFYIGEDVSLYEKTDSQIIKIPLKESEANPEFDALNEQYQNVMKYLTGDEYNMIRMSRGPRINSVDKGEGFQQKINYGEVFFLASEAHRVAGRKEVAEQLKEQAIKNGFHI